MIAPAQKPGVVAAYDYFDADGTPLYQVLRLHPKSFRQRRPDGNGRYLYSLEGVKRVPYRLRQLQVRIEKGFTVLVTEGEKDADALVALKLSATTSAQGAAWKWPPEFVEHFRGAKRVVFIVDCDAPGRAAAHDRAERVSAVVDDVRVLDLAPDRDDGYDVSDWLNEGHSADELLRLVDKAPRFGTNASNKTSAGSIRTVNVVMRRLGEIEAQPVTSLWANRIFFGEPFVLAGQPGVGKSFISGAIAASVTRGEAPPGGGDIDEPGDVIVLALEDDAARVLRPRYEAMDADLSRVHIIDGVRVEEGGRISPFTLSHIEALERALDRVPDARLVIIDPIASVLAGADTFRSNEVREILDPFLDATSARGIAVCMVTHTNKSTTVSGTFRVEGSLGGFVGRARSVLAVGVNADTGRHGVGLLKSNLGRLDVPVIGYEIDALGRFHWLGEDMTTTASELFDQGGPDQDRSASEEVREAIIAFLSSGRKSATEMAKALRGQGLSERTIQRQRAVLKRTGAIVREGGGVAGEVYWRLPESTERQESHSPPNVCKGDQWEELAFNGDERLSVDESESPRGARETVRTVVSEEPEFGF